ncbi:MAG: DNA polymerase III subunit delta, partial [Pseudomonadota bacterium]
RIVSDAGQTIAPDARDALIARLGADRALSRNEIEKLTLYATGRHEITVADVDAIVGDASALSLDRINLAVTSGARGRALEAVMQARNAGQASQAVLLGLQRHFATLHRLSAAVSGGKRVDEVMRSMRPPIHFSIKDEMTAALRVWTIEKLTHATARIQATITATRSQTRLEDALCERLVLELSQLGRRS